MLSLVQANSESEVREARELFREYSAWLDLNLCFQNFEYELASLPGDYQPPEGRLLLAFENERLAGCIALRKIADDVCEMKRLFIRPALQGNGLGRQLVNAIID